MRNLCVGALALACLMPTASYADYGKPQSGGDELCLAKAIYFEARGEPELGQAAVAQVIMNRVEAPHFPDSVCDVVYQGSHRRNACQFSFACDGIPETPREKQAWERAQTLAEQIVDGERPAQNLVKADHFHAVHVQPPWASRMSRLGQVGRHIFYSGS